MNLQMVGAVFLMAGSVGTAYGKILDYESRYRFIEHGEWVLKKLYQKIVLLKITLKGLLEEMAEECEGDWALFFSELRMLLAEEEGEFSHHYDKTVVRFVNKIGLRREEDFLLQGLKPVLLAYDGKEAKMEIEMLLEEQKIIKEEMLGKRKEMKRVFLAVGIAGGMTGVLILW